MSSFSSPWLRAMNLSHTRKQPERCMRRSPFPTALIAMALTCAAIAPAQAAESRVYTRGGYSVDFRDLDGKTQQATADRMVERYFQVYPRLSADFNPGAI